jgi:geranylgeranyl pyrophosphate synthase
MFASVLDQAADFACGNAATSEQRRLFAAAFEDTRRRLAELGVTAEALECVRLPRLVYAAIRGDDTPVRPLTVALTMLYVGMDLWDSVMDRELPEVWQGERPDEVALAAAALIGGVAPSAIAALAAPAERVVAMQAALARAFVAVAAGQQADLRLRSGDTADLATAEAAIAGKAGAVVALFSECAALLAGAADDAISSWREFGHVVGTVGQLQADLWDLFGGRASRDLKSGACTVPIALHLGRLGAMERQEFLSRLESARVDPVSQEAVRTELHRSGVERTCAVLIETYCDQAEVLLTRADVRGPAALSLRQLINERRGAASPVALEVL